MKYFKENEFYQWSKDGNSKIVVFDKMDKQLLNKLDQLRELVDVPITITSSYRDEAYCKRRNIKYSKTSKHNTGNAVDIRVSDSIYRSKVIKGALNLGFSIGAANTFLHLDFGCREKQLLFTYDK